MCSNMTDVPLTILASFQTSRKNCGGVSLNFVNHFRILVQMKQLNDIRSRFTVMKYLVVFRMIT